MPRRAFPGGRFLLIAAGEHVCALPLDMVRRVVPALNVHPLPAADPRLLGLGEYAGEPLPVFDLCTLVQAPAGAAAEFPVTVVAWAGVGADREAVGLAADRALGLAEIPAGELAGPGAGVVRGEVGVNGTLVQVLDLTALGTGT